MRLSLSWGFSEWTSPSDRPFLCKSIENSMQLVLEHPVHQPHVRANFLSIPQRPIQRKLHYSACGFFFLLGLMTIPSVVLFLH